MPTVAFLGLGAIGRPMAACLANAPGITLSVWNRTAAKAASFAAKHGVRHAATPADAVQDADVVFTCLAISADVESLLDGPAGMLGAMKSGSVLVDCTSGDPATSRIIAARLGEKGIRFLDAPVSGGVKGAETASLTVMVGGDESTLAEVQPVIETFAQKVVHCGPVGSGDAVKAGNQALLAIHIWSAGEVLMALAKAGVKPETALEVINASSGRSNSSMNLFPERVIGRKFPRTFRLALLDKDIGIAAVMSRELKVPTPLIQLTADLMRVAHNALGEEADHVEAVKVIEQWSGQVIE
ncbi:MAG: 3-hydroxyisobutyrate dehydrogenase [Gemmatimonadetes bacterium]|nr:3-hydroxyisobutyrate dehydrogenase [Gemmatimonadota bacterium]